MGGFAGLARDQPQEVDPVVLARMGAGVRHRGTGGYGFYAGSRVGLVHLRHGSVATAPPEPLSDPEGRVWAVLNGAIHNRAELRDRLAGRGYHLRTGSDTELLVHAYAEWGIEAVEHLHGEFAFAIYDRAEESVTLGRDRFGVRPLFYTVRHGDLFFGSEIKALLASGEVEAVPCPIGLDEVFTFWAARPPRTVFREIWSLEPGSWVRWRGGRLEHGRYYALDFATEPRSMAGVVEELDALLRGAVERRLDPTLPLGGYLSGGLDSSITTALTASIAPDRPLRTFSVTFADPRFDESTFQNEVATAIGSRHEVQPIAAPAVGEVFPEVIYHTETPIVRTAPAPLYLLSRLTRESGIEMVLTGEGADEVFLGYDLFKETLVRRFCLRQPASAVRPLLFDRLYPYLGSGGRTGEFWRRFFLNAGSIDDPLFSHMPRFLLTSWIKEFYTPEWRAGLEGYDALAAAREGLPPSFSRWTPLSRAAYLEFTTLVPYLLSSQGDRMAMAHGVETRLPFLDHRLFEFAASLPDHSKLAGLSEKVILRQWARDLLPSVVAQRPKQPYRAPDVPAFFGETEPEYVAELLSDGSLAETGIFEPAAVAGLVRRCRTGRATAVRENQALVAILSTQLWFHHFCRKPIDLIPLPLDAADTIASDLAEITT